MKKNNKGSKKHLTKYLRFQILKFLSLDYDVPKIAKLLGFNKSTIYRELTRNSIIENKRHVGFTNPERMPCKNNLHCRNKRQGCIATCKNYMPLTCSLITKPYQVCNFCPRRKGCHFERIIYHPEIADDLAKARFKKGKKKIKLSPVELARFDRYVSPLIIQGQSPEAIKSYSSKEEFPVSCKTLRSYIDQGLMTARNIDLHRKLRYRTKKTKEKRQYSSDPLKKIGHLYEDYLLFIAKHPDAITIQSDTVNGKRKDRKAVLTLHADKLHSQIHILLAHKTPSQVNKAFQRLKKGLGHELYYRVFFVILADNGTEFDHLVDLEKDNDEFHQIHVFYTETYRSNDKAQCERNHQFFRYIRKKGKTLDDLDEDDIFDINNHINSYPRESLKWKSPFEAMKATYGDDIITKLGLKEIKRREVILTAALIRK